LLWALAGAWACFALVSLVLSRPWLTAIEAIAAALTALFAFRSARTHRRTSTHAHGAAGVAALTLFLVCMLTGQSSSVGWWYLLVLPIFVGHVAGTRAMIAWGAFSVLLVVATFLSERWVPIAPLYSFSDVEKSAGGVTLTALVLAYTLFVRRLAEDYLGRAREREATIEHQAAELAQIRDDLAAARDEALSAAEAKSRLMARVSHEVRTPLNGLLGLSEILADSPLAPAQSDVAQTLRASAAALKQLVEDLLDMTRIEEGRLSVNPEATDVRELVGEVVDTFASVAERRGIELVAIVAADVPDAILVDAMRVRQVVANLVSNGLKFTERGQVLIEVAGESTQDKFTGAIRVRDTGPGIPEGQMSQVFQPFEQLDTSLALRRQGTGLGLWIARQVAHAMGSELQVESKVGEGSTFSLSLTVPASGTPVGASGLLLIGASMLAVEPHPASRRALEQIGGHTGLQLRAVASLDEARRAIATEDVDLVLVAANPSMSPKAALRVIRRVSRKSRLAIAVGPGHPLSRSPVPEGYAALTLKPYRESRLRGLLVDVLAQAAEPLNASEPPSALGLRCLVVDDDSTNRMVARLLLTRGGHRVLEAPDAESGYALMERGELDVVFLDLHMPGEDGVSLARRARAELDPRLWLVALTAASGEEERQACHEAGMDDFVCKPVEVGLLRAALERAGRGIRRRSSPSRPSMPAQREREGALHAPTLEALLDQMGDEGALLIETYASNGALLLADLRRALEGDSSRAAHRAAHTLASSSALVGAAAVAEVAKAIEEGLEQGRAPIPKDLEALERDFGVACRELGRRVAHSSDGS
jgi:signal transduction histidine kinase/CheY-like chemotaxis protein